MSDIRRFWSGALVAWAVLGCGDDTTPGPDATDDGTAAEDGVGADADADGDGDAPVDVEVGPDADADGDGDAPVDVEVGPDADADADAPADVPDSVTGRLQVEFATGQPPGTAGGVRGRGVYIWVEDAAGRYIDTIVQYFGRVTPGCTPTDTYYACSGYRYYDDNCVDWHAVSGETGPLATDPLVPPDVTGTALNLDGVTGATPLPQPGGLPGSSGTITAPEWDCRDRLGNPIPRGDYAVQIEITWERDDGLGHRRPCEAYPGEFPCQFRYSTPVTLGTASTSAAITPNDWMLSSGTVTFTTP